MQPRSRGLKQIFTKGTEFHSSHFIGHAWSFHFSIKQIQNNKKNSVLEMGFKKEIQSIKVK